MTIILPSPATVFTLRGLSGPYEYMPGWLGGIFDRAPYKPVRINYPATGAANSISEGARMFNEAARATPGFIIGVGHSQGSQALARVIEAWQNDPTAPSPERVVFILTGNPLRNPTGRGIGQPEFDGRMGKPAPASRYRVIDVARQRDGWAIKGAWWDFQQLLGMFTVHPKYQDVDLFSPANVVQQVGNTTFVTTP